MQGKDVLRALVGGALVYAAMAACSGLAPSNATSAGGSGGGGGTTGIANPVPDANAAGGTDVATEQCSKTATNTLGTYAYAEHAYPGKSATDLARVAVLGTVNPAAGAVMPSGYPYVVGYYVLVRDGSVAVMCGSTSAPLNFTAATFILPL